MVRTEEIQPSNSTMAFTLPLPVAKPTPALVPNAKVAVHLARLQMDGVVLSGTQLIWGGLSALSFVGVFWAILKLWLYE
jgi:hypothetical protein